MSDEDARILIESITNAIKRIRLILFANLSICAIIFTNVYVENWAFDVRQLKFAHLLIQQHDKRIKQISPCIESIDAFKECDISIRGTSSLEELKKEESARVFWMNFSRNSLKAVKLSSTDVPILGLKIPSNDLNFICGVFMITLSAWLILSSNQINQILTDKDALKILKKYSIGIRHTFTSIYSGEHWSVRVMAISVILAPAIAMSVSFLSNNISFVNLLISQNPMGKDADIITFAISRLLIELGMSMVLAWAGYVALARWRKLSDSFYSTG